jgi:hypothetical protein
MPVLIALLVPIYFTTTPDFSNMLFNIGVFIFTLDNSSAFFINLTFNSIFYDEFSVMIGKKMAPSIHD